MEVARLATALRRLLRLCQRTVARGLTKLCRKLASMSDDASGNVLDDGLFDWRIRLIQRRQLPTGLGVIDAPGELQAPTGEIFSFADFMATALYLNVAITADAQANKLREEFKLEEIVARTGPSTTIKHENLGPLFDFIEQSAIAVIFSFQALEAYSNYVIQFVLREREHMFRRPGQSRRMMPADEIERYGETMEKLKTVVRQLLKVSPPTKETFWQELCEIKKVRDALTHLKYKDQSGAATAAAAAFNATRADPDFVFYKLVSGEITDSSRTAVEILDFFTRKTGTPRWLLYPLSVYGITPTPPTGTTRITLGPPD
jgi:hypothetical protein